MNRAMIPRMPEALDTREEPQGESFRLGIQVRPYNHRMRERRLALGLSQKGLGEMAGIPYPTIQKLETFSLNYTLPWLELDRVAAVLGESTDVLFPTWLQAKVVREAIAGDIPLPISESMANSDAALQASVQQMIQHAVGSALKALSPRERSCIEYRFGLVNPPGELRPRPMTLEETARAMNNVTRERVRQIEAHARRKMLASKALRATARVLGLESEQ